MPNACPLCGANEARVTYVDGVVACGCCGKEYAWTEKKKEGTKIITVEELLALLAKPKGGSQLTIHRNKDFNPPLVQVRIDTWIEGSVGRATWTIPQENLKVSALPLTDALEKCLEQLQELKEEKADAEDQKRSGEEKDSEEEKANGDS